MFHLFFQNMHMEVIHFLSQESSKSPLGMRKTLVNNLNSSKFNSKIFFFRIRVVGMQIVYSGSVPMHYAHLMTDSVERWRFCTIP